jgi:hypothetical protein
MSLTARTDYPSRPVTVIGTGTLERGAMAVKANALGDYLRARRQQVRPEDVGLANRHRHRPPQYSDRRAPVRLTEGQRTA